MVFWILAGLLIAFSSISFFFVKKPGLTIDQLMERNTGYWYKNLDRCVPEKWVAPIYYSGLLGVVLFVINTIYIVFTDVS